MDALFDDVGVVSSIDAEIMLREGYDITYGLYDHDQVNPNKPMALVAQHPMETLTDVLPVYSTIRRYHRYEVNSNFGLSLTEFLELPREYTEFIFTVLADKARERAPQLEHELNKLDNNL